MDFESVLSELSNYLPNAQIQELRLNHSLSSSKNAIIFCMTINDIVKAYNSTEENEDKVRVLLCNICHIHFNQQQK